MSAVSRAAAVLLSLLVAHVSAFTTVRLAPTTLPIGPLAGRCTLGGYRGPVTERGLGSTPAPGGRRPAGQGACGLRASFLGSDSEANRPSTRRPSLVVTHAKKTGKGGAATAKGFGAAAAPKAAAPPKSGALPTTSEVFEVTPAELVEGVNCDLGSQGAGVPMNTLFMGAFQIEDLSVIDGLNAVYDSNPDMHRRGEIGRDGKPVIDLSKKDSFEIFFRPDDPRPEWARYVGALQACTKAYVDRYQYAANYVGDWGLSWPTNLQHYPPGGGYKTFHTERRDRFEPGASRHLVFMTYLNDVTDAGGTEFYHQNVVIRPKKGLTLIWPSDWTFMHRGIPSPTQEKRIMTGWFNFS